MLSWLVAVVKRNLSKPLPLFKLTENAFAIKIKEPMKTIQILTLIVLGCTSGFPMESELWKDFVAAKQGQTTPVLPDFSYAGYHYCEKPIPDVSHKVFLVTEFGAIPNDNQSDELGIQAAITAAEQHGSGVVLFPVGRFDVSTTKEEAERSIFIRHSHIVLRGAGSGKEGTIIFAKYDHPKGTYKFQFDVPDRGVTYLGDITADAVRETFRIQVADSSQFTVGQRIALTMTNKDPKVKNWYLQPYKARKEWHAPIAFREYHQIAGIDGKDLVLREPIHVDIFKDHGWRIESFSHIEEVGVEDIAFLGNFKDKFVHHKNIRHDKGWSILAVQHAVNSWVSRCRFKDVSRALWFDNCAAVSGFNIKVHGNGGHHGLKLEATYGGLIGLSHDAVSFHGPNVETSSLGCVYWRVTSPRTNVDCHGEYSLATLHDKPELDFRSGRMGSNKSELPNHLRKLIFWNAMHTGKGKKYDWWKGMHDTNVMPIMVGVHGNPIAFDKKKLEVEESPGNPVMPESLFEAQLAHRLGEVPEWLLTLRDRK